MKLFWVTKTKILKYWEFAVRLYFVRILVLVGCLDLKVVPVFRWKIFRSLEKSPGLWPFPVGWWLSPPPRVLTSLRSCLSPDVTAHESWTFIYIFHRRSERNKEEINRRFFPVLAVLLLHKLISWQNLGVLYLSLFGDIVECFWW